MSDTDRPMTPFEPFVEPPATEETNIPRDTEQSGPPDSGMEPAASDDMNAAMMKLEAALERQAENTRRAIEESAAATRVAINGFLNTVLARFAEGNVRFDAHAKGIRALNAQVKELREKLNLPETHSLVDEL